MQPSKPATEANHLCLRSRFKKARWRGGAGGRSGGGSGLGGGGGDGGSGLGCGGSSSDGGSDVGGSSGRARGGGHGRGPRFPAVAALPYRAGPSGDCALAVASWRKFPRPPVQL